MSDADIGVERGGRLAREGVQDTSWRLRKQAWSREPETNQAYPEFAYSESREACRRSCARAYYFAAYAAHRGRDAPVGSLAFVAYRLRETISVTTAITEITQCAAAACVRSILSGNGLPTLADLWTRARAELNALWSSSRYCFADFWHRPDDVPMLTEALYEGALALGTLHHARQRMERCLATLLNFEEFWRVIADTHPTDVLLLDRGIRVYLPDDVLAGGVRCDATATVLVRRRPLGTWRVVDLACADRDGARQQLLTFALAARHGLELDFAEGCDGALIVLEPQSERCMLTFNITSEDFNATTSRIRESVVSMRGLLFDVTANVPHSVEAFPPVQDVRTCASCVFRGLCYSDVYTLRAGRLAPMSAANG